MTKERYVDEEIQALLLKEAIVEVQYTEDCFVSNIFLAPKPNGTFRMIIDLSYLNEFIEKESFKMESLETVKCLIEPHCWMSSIDLKDAYFSLAIHEDYQKFLVFQWKGKFYKYIVLPFGITIAPRVFTKVLKPVFCEMRKLGCTVAPYLDES